MFVRTTTRRNRDGTAVSYLQLVHNEWDPAAKSSKMKVVYNFGRADQLDTVRGIERLIGSLTRGVGLRRRWLPGAGTPGLEFTASRPLGGAYVLNGSMGSARVGQDPARPVGRHPSGPGHRTGVVRPGREPGVGALLEAGRHELGEPRRAPARPGGGVRRRVLSGDGLAAGGGGHPRQGRVPPGGRLVELEVDLLFFDTTSTYFVTEQADEPAPGATAADAPSNPPPTPPLTEPLTARWRRRRRGEAGRVVDQDALALGEDGVAVFHDTAKPSAMRATVRWATTRPSSAHRNARRDSLERGSAALPMSWRHTCPHSPHR